MKVDSGKWCNRRASLWERAVMSPAKSHRERIAEEVRRRIVSGEWEPGRKLPTTRDLAVEFRCAGGTVEWALDRLMAEGWIRGHQGLGRYVADTPPAG